MTNNIYHIIFSKSGLICFIPYENLENIINIDIPYKFKVFNDRSN